MLGKRLGSSDQAMEVQLTLPNLDQSMLENKFMPEGITFPNQACIFDNSKASLEE